MRMDKNRRFYLLSLAALAALSAYPLAGGVRMACISLADGAIEPEQYVKYVVPYAAICVSILLFAALRPLFVKLGRPAFAVGLVSAYGAFFAVERFFETMQIRATGMTLVSVSTLTPDAADWAATVDIWQAALCAISPDIRGQSLTYARQEKFYYVIGDSGYKIHYYLISLVLITMVCGLLHGIAGMLRDNDRSQTKPIFLRGVSTAALVALCIFANTTAFFRQAAPVQTPLASVLTGLFFVALGAAAGVYAGSYLLKKGTLAGMAAPVCLSLCAAALMYAGEAIMMRGNLYRFGRGWFFGGLPGVALAPADLLIILLSGAATWLILGAARKRGQGPGRRTVIASIALCAAVAAAGPVIALAASESRDGDILGCYVFDENLYTNPLSSFMAYGGLPYVYGFDENEFIIADTESGDIRRYAAEYCKTPVGTDEFSSPASGFFSGRTPDLARYAERYLLAVMSDESGPRFGLYRMDGELWLTELRDAGIWSVYRLVKTGATTLADLARATERGNPPPAPSPALYENQMTLRDVYALARKGEALTLRDFEPFAYRLSGPDFTVRRYDVVGADTLFVRLREGGLESALLTSRRTPDPSKVIDLRQGFGAVARYMNPLDSFMDVKIEDAQGGEDIRELIYEYDYDQCRYYLNTKRADGVFVLFADGERLPLKRALEERRITIEDAVAHGLYNVSAVPIDNPLKGEFTILHHLYTFSLNGEAFYPSKSFMYAVWGDNIAVYYDMDELIQFLEWYGYDAAAERLRRTVGPADITSVARGNYVRDRVLARAGIESAVGWAYSSHTPVWFDVKE